MAEIKCEKLFERGFSRSMNLAISREPEIF
jgi:hypothetical protein